MRAIRTGFAISLFGLGASAGTGACSGQELPSAESDARTAVPAALVAGGTVKVGPAVGTEKPKPMPTTLGMYPALASNGDGFLSVSTIAGSIRGSRVDGEGNVLDLEWFDFGEDGYGQYYADVAFGAGHYLVAWSQFLEGGQDGSIRGRFVKADGTVEGTSSIQLGGDGLYPSVAWDGTHFVVAWLGFSASTSSIRYALFDAAGKKLDGSEQAVSTTGSATNPRVTAGTDYSLITWQEYEPDSSNGLYKILGTRIDKSGARKDDPALSIGPTTYATRGYASVAAAGSRYLVAWTPAGSTDAIHGSIVSDTGSMVKIDFPISRSSGSAALPCVDFDGTNFLVAWADTRGENSVFGTTVSLDGEVNGTVDKQLTSGGPRSAYSGSSDRVNVAFNGTRHLVSYLGDGVEASLVDQNLGIVRDEFNLTSLPGKQGFPHLAWDGTNYVLVWTDESDPDFSKATVRAVRISVAGAVLDPNGIAVTPADTYTFGTDLASNGKNRSLITYGADSPWLLSLESSGSLGNASALTGLRASPSLTSNGTTYVATYTTGDSTNGAVFGRIIQPDGSVGAEIRIDSSTVNTGASAVPVKGGYLVSYAKSGTYVATLSDAGVVGTPLLLQADYTYISGGCDGNTTLVTWDSRSDEKIHARFFEDGAWSGAEFVVSEASGGNEYPSTVWDGTGYYVAWEVADTDRRSHIVGRSVSRSGALGPIQTLVAEDVSGVVLASNGQNQMLISYIKWIENANSRRIYSRQLTPGGAEGTAGSGNTSSGGQGNTSTAVDGSGGSSPTSSMPVGGSGVVSAGGSESMGGTGPNATSTKTGTSAGGQSGTKTGSSTSDRAEGGSSGSTVAGSDPTDEVGCTVRAGGGSSRSLALFVVSALSAVLIRRRRLQH